ncbi:RHS repeat-associated core domain-containing protein [Pseudomonas sp. QTF5]|uniref:RHS repeat-associated core domain-containing protein n=1 Tax=Pseudomonas sp. QTF5 TaxID=1435425 RepID=UPI0035321F72
MPTHSSKTILLATDQQNSVLNALEASRPHPIAYTPYGHRPHQSGLLSLLGFNGELPDPVTGHYHLGNGYRQFNPVLMRFNSPDSWSPFGEGGLNAYAYCAGDPANRSDPSGHVGWLKKFLIARGWMKRPTLKPTTANRNAPLTQPAQINTRENLNSLIPEDGRPNKILEIQNHLEQARQDHAFNLEHYPNTTTYRSQSHIKIENNYLPSRKAYSRLAIEHHNKIDAPLPSERISKIAFADSPVIHEFEPLVEMPDGGWKKVADIRK